MQYVHYKAQHGNFGDDLNDWLWPKLFGSEIHPDKFFVGIGSILFSSFPPFESLANSSKIVFGTGVRPLYEPLQLDSTWDVRFLRGPLSAYSLQNKYPYIADGAYALRLADGFDQLQKQPKKHKISVIPYFKSISYFNWEQICSHLGYNYISPLAEQGLDHTLREIAASEYIITEAMHGAIIADLFRVPWARFVLSTPHTEGQMVSEFKWMDWLFSVGLPYNSTTPIDFYGGTKVNRLMKAMTNQVVDTRLFMKGKVQNELTNKLRLINNYSLSDDKAIYTVDDKINEQISLLKKNQ